MSKERPILFSAPMANAILAGNKTQTRRIVKPQPRMVADHAIKPWDGDPVYLMKLMYDTGKYCPYGKPGDRLFVRETFFAYGRWVTQFSAKKGRDEWHFIDMTKECDRAYQYASDNPDIPLATGRGPLPGWYRRPAIFMPRIACRISLEIVSVRVERLQDISEADCAKEGAPFSYCGFAPEDAPDWRGWYRELWETINGAGSWDKNPWVWVVEFRRIEK